MFTGIVSEIAQISSLHDQKGRRYLTLGLQQTDQIQLGDSVALNGTCLTAKKISGRLVTFEAIQETLQLTNLGQLEVGSWVNIELALRPLDRLGGHLVSGHIDGLATIQVLENHPEQGYLTLEMPTPLTKMCLYKGSIAIDGVSLTITDVTPTQVSCALIQHTLEKTIFQYKKKGDVVNIETDLIGKWVQRLLQPESQVSSKPSLQLDFLKEHGYL